MKGRKGGRKRSSIHWFPPQILILQDQGWARPKPRARSFFWVSNVCAGAQDLGSSATAFSDTSSRSWTGNETVRVQTGNIWDTDITGRGFTCYATMLALENGFSSHTLKHKNQDTHCDRKCVYCNEFAHNNHSFNICFIMTVSWKPQINLDPEV